MSATLLLVTVLALAASAGATGSMTGMLDDRAGGAAPSGSTNLLAAGDANAEHTREQSWSWHVQNTDILQGSLPFPAGYSGRQSLDNQGEVRETVSLDLMAGVRLWHGAEALVDGMIWQGFGLSKTLGAAGFPNGEAFRLGTTVPNFNFARLFLRQTIGLGGEQEGVEDDEIHLAGMQDISRVTLTAGRVSVKDIFDNNSYCNSPRTQFMNWSLMANSAWDYPAGSLGYMSGFAAELNQPGWAARYGFFQAPEGMNGTAPDPRFLDAWAMVVEFERRFTIHDHPGAVRLLAFVNRAHMGSFGEALDLPARPVDIEATRAYRCKYGFGLNVEQEIIKNVGVFGRLGWDDGQTESWMFTDVDRTLSVGTSIKGEFWRRPNDTYGLAWLLNGLSNVQRDFFAAGGTGILVGDGTLTYGMEMVLETYYDFQIWKSVHGAFDYQFINHPAYNRDRGPVSIFGVRLH